MIERKKKAEENVSSCNGSRWGSHGGRREVCQREFVVGKTGSPYEGGESGRQWKVPLIESGNKITSRKGEGNVSFATRAHPGGLGEKRGREILHNSDEKERPPTD